MCNNRFYVSRYFVILFTVFLHWWVFEPPPCTLFSTRDVGGGSFMFKLCLFT